MNVDVRIVSYFYLYINAYCRMVDVLALETWQKRLVPAQTSSWQVECLRVMTNAGAKL